ncbi:dockerin type I domain-containing protein [Methylomonas sp. AM2-LC]|uniref:InlB B-repeat-containing protein n=1 Tax=Methylomonas sp. AM2-LC TaxID=3153301 RepID=UPI0032653DFA
MKIKVFSLLGYLALCAGMPITETAADPYASSPYTTLICGGENMAACVSTSDFAINMYSDPLLLPKCDKGLTVSGNLCVRNSTGHANLFANPNSWLGFAMQEQMYGIGAHQQANWGNYLGSHNSYSTYADNAKSSLSADQVLSMTDQLQEGMRIIRMDPRFYSGQIRLCHNTAYGILDESNNFINCATDGKNFPSAYFTIPDQILKDLLSIFGKTYTVSDLISDTGLAGPSSEGRLYALGMHEVAEWLKKNPGEFIIIRLLGTSELDKAHYYWIDDAINIELGNLAYQPPADGSTLDHWPSLRELRGAGKQVIVFSDTGTNTTWDWSKYVIDDGYTDTSGYRYPTCQNQGGFPIAARNPNQWSYVGEDRSGSNFFASGPKGALGEGAIADATKCGYSMINLDFLLAGSRASQASIQYDICAGIDVTSDCYKTYTIWNYSFPDPDVRRVSFIWSWGINEFGNDGPAAMALKYTFIGNPLATFKAYEQGHWLSDAASNQHAFACAGPKTSTGIFPDPDHPADYTWAVTQTRAAWTQGESVCQKEFGAQFHFWAPAGGQENQNLFSIAFRDRLSANPFNPDSDPIWLNHIARLITAAPNSLSLAPQQNATINVLGGKGGKLETQVTGSHLKATVSGTQVEVESLLGSAPGSFNESIVIREVDPATGGFLQAPLIIPVTVNVPGVTLHVKAEIPGASISVAPHINVDGKDYALPADVQVLTNSNHEISLHPVMEISPDTRLKFNGWMDGGSQNKAVHVGVKDAVLIGKFTPEYLLTVKSVPATGGSATGTGWYDLNSTPNLKATPTSNYLFQQFQGDFVKSIHNPFTVPNINKPETIVADFLLIGDLNADGIVDTKDLAILQKVLNTNTSGPTDIRDLNHDGLLNALDMRILVTKCTHSQCAS